MSVLTYETEHPVSHFVFALIYETEHRVPFSGPVCWLMRQDSQCLSSCPCVDLWDRTAHVSLRVRVDLWDRMSSVILRARVLTCEIGQPISLSCPCWLMRQNIQCHSPGPCVDLWDRTSRVFVPVRVDLWDNPHVTSRWWIVTVIGGKCKVSNNCYRASGLPAYCDRSVCICPKRYHPTQDGTDCIQTIRKFQNHFKKALHSFSHCRNLILYILSPSWFKKIYVK
jgi:hypothetical protein